MEEGGKNTLPTTILYMIMAGTAFFPLMITCNWDGRLVGVVDNVAGEEVFAVAAGSGRVSDDGFVVSTSEVMVEFVKMRICLGLQMVEFVMLVTVAAAVVKVEMQRCSSTLCYHAYPGRNWVEKEESLVETR
ncbi:hypothetical protein D5086_033837 [Populus alba]|uniref:Uncharacterized protein n=1 Tax=Populus alba TaxID=43335 RepID=A0ACC4AI01_POPAL